MKDEKNVSYFDFEESQNGGKGRRSLWALGRIVSFPQMTNEQRLQICGVFKAKNSAVGILQTDKK